MVKVTMISDERDEMTGKFKRVKLKLSFWSVLKMYLIGWFLTTTVIIVGTLAVRSIFDVGL